MPVVYTQAVWDSLYHYYEYVGDVKTLRGYTRSYVDKFSNMQNTRKDWLTGYGLDNNARVIVIGPGLGSINESLIDAGIDDTWAIEPSPHVWANSTDVRSDVLAKMVNANVGVTPTSTIQSLFAGLGMGNPRRGDWILDEDVISSQIDDAGINAFLGGCEELLQGNAKGRIVHIVTPSQLPDGTVRLLDSQLLSKTMVEWKAYAPDHTWVDARTGVVA